MNEIVPSWFVCRTPQASPRIKLFCFPYAGGGSSIYRKWNFFNDIELHAALLPGRENRFNEPPVRSMDDLIEKLLGALAENLDAPFAFFGHSMGALIAYELAAVIQSVYGISPVHLFVSGKGAPHVKQQQSPIYNLPTDILLDKIISLGGTPSEIIENKEALTFYEPLLRGDFELCDTYRYRNRDSLICPITILGGYGDQTVSMEALEGWKELTTGPASLKMFAGDHFFIHPCRKEIQQLIYNRLITCTASNNRVLQQ